MHSEIYYTQTLELKIYQILDTVETTNLFGETVKLFKLKSAYGRNVERY